MSPAHPHCLVGSLALQPGSLRGLRELIHEQAVLSTLMESAEQMLPLHCRTARTMMAKLTLAACRGLSCAGLAAAQEVTRLELRYCYCCRRLELRPYCRCCLQEPRC